MGRLKFAYLAFASPLALAACVTPVEPVADVCDDSAEPDCAPDREIEVE